MSVITVKIDSSIRLDKKELKRAGINLRAVRDPFTYDNPDFWKKKRMGFYTGDVDREITLVEDTAREILIPRGGWERLKRVLSGAELRVEDLMTSGTGPLGMTYAEPDGWDLGPDQLTAARMALLRKQGIILGPCACLQGSTEIYDPVEGITLSVEERFRRGQQFHVLARSKFGYEPALALAPLKFPPHELVELTTENGVFCVTPDHLIWGGASFWIRAGDLATSPRVCGPLRRSSPFLIPSTSVDIQRVPIEGVPPPTSIRIDTTSPLRGDVLPSTFFSVSSRTNTTWTEGVSRVISARWMKAESYYDFCVPTHGNYVAEGHVHHNSGKTEILLKFISDAAERALVIVHTERILKSWAEKVAERFFIKPADVGLLYGKAKRERRLTIGMVRTVLNLVRKKPEFVKRWGVLVLDEAHHCFPAGTPVGGRPIEDLRPGDVVPAFDPGTLTPTSRRVVENLARPATALVEVEVGGERQPVSPDHPYFTRRGWVEAGNLRVGDVVLCFMHAEEYLRVREAGGGEGDREVLRGLPAEAPGASGGRRGVRVRGVRDAVRAERASAPGPAGERVLLAGVPGRVRSTSVLRDDASNEPRPLGGDLGSDASAEPDARRGDAGARLDDASPPGMGSLGPRGERGGGDHAAAPPRGRSRLGGRGLDPDGLRTGGDGVPDVLQGGPRGSRAADRDRGRRELASGTLPPGSRPEAGRVPRWLRVDDVAVLEPGRDGTFNGRAPDGRVYNLRVEGEETFLVGNLGLAVHNCPASTFAELVNAFPARWRIAATATPKRKDGKEVLFYDTFGSVYEPKLRGTGDRVGPRVLFEITDADLDRYDRIIPVDVVVVPTEFEFDLNLERTLERAGWEREDRQSAIASAKAWARETGFDGSLNTYADMLDEMARDAHRQARILEYLLPELRGKETCLMLADRREFCLDTQAWLKRRKVACGRLMGGKNSKEQDRTATGLSDGSLLCAVGTTVGDEGMDIGRLSRGFGCTPTASNPGRLTQQLGRFKRKHPGKTSATYYYFWDRRVRGLRGHAREVAKAVQAPHRVWFSEKPGERVPLTRELLKRLEG